MVQDQDDMTWDDYRPIPGHNWADPSLQPERGFRLAIMGIDFPDQPFVITMPKGSDPFGNPQIDPVAREDVSQFYADFWMTPSEVNHFQTINGYWMEQSRGKFGITEVEAFGLFRLDVSVSGEGWSARLLNALAAVEAGASQSVTVYVSPEAGSADEATLTLRATSESDPSQTASVTVVLGG